jgi:hypothetical protein
MYIQRRWRNHAMLDRPCEADRPADQQRQPRRKHARNDMAKGCMAVCRAGVLFSVGSAFHGNLREDDHRAEGKMNHFCAATVVCAGHVVLALTRQQAVKAARAEGVLPAADNVRERLGLCCSRLTL